MKKTLLLACIGSLLIVGLAGCGSSEPEAAAAPMTEQEMADAGIGEGSAADSAGQAPSYAPDPQAAASDL